MADKDLRDRLGPLDFTRPWVEINARFVNLRAELGGIATPSFRGAAARPATRRPTVTELDKPWDQAASEHPDPDAKPFFPTKP